MAVKDGWGQEVAVEMNPGDVLYFNGYLLHRSTKNRSDIYRRVLTNHYMSQTTLLPWDAVDKARKQSAGKYSLFRFALIRLKTDTLVSELQHSRTRAAWSQSPALPTRSIALTKPTCSSVTCAHAQQTPIQKCTRTCRKLGDFQRATRIRRVWTKGESFDFVFFANSWCWN
jgi:hypothetical protein